MRSILMHANVDIKRFFRDPVLLFFTILLPLIFLFVFGSLSGGETSARFRVALFDHADTAVSHQVFEAVRGTSVFTVVDTASIDAAKEAVTRGQLDAIIELPTAFGAPDAAGYPRGKAQVIHSPASAEVGQAVSSVLEATLTHQNEAITEIETPLQVQVASTGEAGYRRFDYVFSGLIGFTLLSLGVFVAASVFPENRQSGALRRVSATPFGRGKLIASSVISYTVTGLAALAIMVVVAMLCFRFQMHGSWLQLGMFATISLVSTLAIGFFCGGITKTANQASILSNILSFPLMFLSGMFFPRYMMPDWLQPLTDWLPLTQIIDGTRYIITEHKTLLDLGPQLGVIGLWAVVLYVVVVRRFKWE